jgi:hypothetical protein
VAGRADRVCHYLAIGTRVVGISLAAGLALYDVVRLCTISRSTVVSIAVCGAFVSLQRYVTGIGLSGYRHEHPTFHSIASNIAIYTRATASFWVGSTRNLFAYAVLVLLVALVVKGIFRSGEPPVHVRGGRPHPVPHDHCCLGRPRGVFG